MNILKQIWRKLLSLSPAIEVMICYLRGGLLANIMIKPPQEYFNGANMMFLAAMGIAASVQAAGLHRRIALG